MALSKQIVTPKGISLNYFRIESIKPIFSSEESIIEVILDCYVSKDYRDLDEKNNVVEKYFCTLPLVDENNTREIIYPRIKAEVEEFNGALDV
jgi:hypothetical protein